MVEVEASEAEVDLVVAEAGAAAVAASPVADLQGVGNETSNSYS